MSIPAACAVSELPRIGICRSTDAARTRALAAALANLCRGGDCIALYGDVGMGKTTWAQGFIPALVSDVAEGVTSPTFTLVQAYDACAQGQALPLWHVDLYRITSPEEVPMLGIEEILPVGIVLIEWPQHAPDLLPPTRLDIVFTPGEGANARILALHGGEDWPARLRSLDCIELLPPQA